MDNSYEEARNRFIHVWGEMGSKWGINKAMAQIHALLMISEQPISTDDLMKELSMSRGHVNTNLRDLMDWGIVRKVFVKGERREFFQSEKDVWNMFCRIARERKKRELEPAIDALEECLKLTSKEKAAAHFKGRLAGLLDLLKMGDILLGKVAAHDKNKIVPRILKMLA